MTELTLPDRLCIDPKSPFQRYRRREVLALCGDFEGVRAVDLGCGWGTISFAPNFAYDLCTQKITDDQLEGIDLLRLSQKPSREVLIVSSDASPDALALKDHLASLGARAAFQHIPGSKVYLKEDEINQAVVPHGTLQSISTWLSESGA